MTTQGTFDRGPFLLAALLCEKVLQEQDGVKSAIRIIDRVTHTVVGPNPPSEMDPFDYDAALLLRLKSGSARGLHTLGIRLVKPSGESPTPMTQSVIFEGEEDRGVDVVVNLRIRFDQSGIYWFQISLNNVRLTQVPLRVVYMPETRQIGGQGEGQPPAQELPPGA